MVEISLGGALVPSLAAYVAASIVLFLATDRVASAIGFYRAVWHPALVRVALWASLFSGLVLSTGSGGLLW
ncbi:MAG TPA: DUF1656 domain-containing protein [Acetobacteraceae bacterium]|nr:DUF1656 domain-containing protein [Acetobacteraceae bacterium]